MTITYGTIYVAHHARTTTSAWEWLTGLFGWRRRRPATHRPAGTIVHVGITEELPVLDPEPVTNALDPSHCLRRRCVDCPRPGAGRAGVGRGHRRPGRGCAANAAGGASKL